MQIENRVNYIDAIKGLAIVLMFYAHLLPHYDEHSTFLGLTERLVSSLAAPIFLFLVGYNYKPFNSISIQLQRVLVIFLFAVLIDLFVWKIFPFYSFDVLYTIGFSLLFLRSLAGFNYWVKWGVFMLLFLSVVGIKLFNAYNISLSEPYLWQPYNIKDVFYNLFINGWFPLFPWLLFSLMGHLFREINLDKMAIKIGSIILFLLSLVVVFNSTFLVRPFAVEIFYPVGFAYLFVSISWLLCIWSNRTLFSGTVFQLLSPLGRTSLIMYAVHLSIYHLCADFMVQKEINRYLAFMLFLICFYIIALLTDRYKSKWSFYSKYAFIRIILGS
jgi:uncharacterized membrane protein